MPGAQPGDRPVLLHCRAPGAMQMNCPDGSRKHDMIVTAVPGDVRYSPISHMAAPRRRSTPHRCCTRPRPESTRVSEGEG